MAEIKEVRISGFRGIKNCLKLNFKKGSTFQSMVIYGRNGTGKSSITDAFEWLQTDHIEHLRREGAGVGSYPHKFAANSETFVEVDFINPEIGTLRLAFDQAKPTKFIYSGNIEGFRSLAPHPCFIRYEDLTRFVILTKTERFDSLSKLMGFVPQVEIQKSLRRVLRLFTDSLSKDISTQEGFEKQLSKLLDSPNISKEIFLNHSNQVLQDHGISPSSSIKELDDKKNELNNKVINDPIAKELSKYKTVLLNLQSLNKILPPENLFNDFLENLKSFIKNEHDVSKLLLLSFYQQGEKIINLKDSSGNSYFLEKNVDGKLSEICPLCGQIYKDDLYSHVIQEIDKLNDLKTKKEEIEKKQQEIIHLIPSKGAFLLPLSFPLADKELINSDYDSQFFKSKCLNLEKSIEDLTKLLNFQVSSLSQTQIDEIKITYENCVKSEQTFYKYLSKSKVYINNIINQLEKTNLERSKLVDDNTNFQFSLKIWGDFEKIKKLNDKNSQILRDATQIVDDYVQNSIKNVEARFRTISDDVKDFFDLLEQDTEGLSGAMIKLLAEEDRAVELQINFHGDQVYPAYKYLSESQLNSFGLSVFLASTKHFNKNFKFIVLDDIINSFDGYKRPRICELLKTKFSTHQILLFTHDNVWHDRLFEAFPTSVKKRFTRWDINHGPYDLDGLAPIEEIEQLIEDDKPSQAGAIFGPFLERQLQDLCENFEVFVKYTRTNEYSLDPLFDRFRIRIKEKLGNEHPLVKAVQEFYDDLGFRNLCAHWKEPSIQLTKEEMRIVLQKWYEIEKIAKCNSPTCLGWVKYDGHINGFSCYCRNIVLTKGSI